MIGPSGVLNINKLDYYIYKLQLIQEYEVIKNEEQSQKNRENGLKIMDEALSNLINNAKVTWINTNLGENKVESIDLTYLITDDGNMPPEELGGMLNTFLVDYTKGYEIYFKGVQGDYSIKLDDNNNPIKKEIYNVIIDYELKEESK